MDNHINTYTSQQLADTIVEYIRRAAEIGGLENFTDLRIMNNSDGLAFEITRFEVVAPSEGVTHDRT